MQMLRSPVEVEPESFVLSPAATQCRTGDAQKREKCITQLLEVLPMQCIYNMAGVMCGADLCALTVWVG